MGAMSVLDAIVAFNSQTAGRDRVFRLFQYGSRLLWWLAEHHKNSKDYVNKLKNLEYSLSTGRKLLRLGRSLESFYAALKTIHLPDLTLRVTLTMAKVNHALFLVVDHIVWLGRVGLVDINKQSWTNLANKFWLFSILLLLSRDVYEISHLLHVERSRRPVHSKAFLQRCSRLSVEHKDLVLDTVKNSCDAVIPSSGLGFVNVSPGVVGLCGVISSLIGMFTIAYPKWRLTPC